MCSSKPSRLTRPSIERDFVGDRVVDVADEAQRQVIIFRIDPARARQPAAQHRQRLADIGGDFETGEEARHGETLTGSHALSLYDRARAHPGDQLFDLAAGYAPRSRRRRRRSDAARRAD